MKYLEFKNSLGSDKVGSIYLFEGEDAFFRERGAFLLKDKFVSEPQLNYTVLSGEKLTDKELVNAISAYPFMSQKRLTVVREYYPKKDQIGKDLKNYFLNPVSDSMLAVLNEKPCEALKKFESVQVVDCGRAELSLVVRWISSHCKASGVEIQLETASLIADYCLCDMVRVENETEKLISYALESKRIEKEDVEQMVNKDAEHKIYEMTEYIGKKQFENALSVVNDMLAKGEALQVILVSVYNYFRRLLHVAISAEEDGELSKQLGIQPYAVKKIRFQAKTFNKKALKSAVDLLVETDYRMKCGLVDADDGIWYSLFKIMTM